MPQGVGYPPAPAVRPAAPGPAGQSSGFADALRRPEVQAALLQFGINMMTPRAGGFGAQLGYGLGGAGQAAGRVSLQRLKEQQGRRAEEREDERLALDRRRTDIAQQRADQYRPGEAAGQRVPVSHQLPPFNIWLQNKLKDETFTPEEQNEKFWDDTYRTDALKQYMELQRMGVSTGGGAAEGGSGALAGPESESSLVDEARQAISRGAPRDSVLARLREMGVEPPGDL